MRKTNRTPRWIAVTATVVALAATGNARATYNLTTLASFNGYDGVYPCGGLAISGNNLYGTTTFGGPGFSGVANSGYGTVFSVPITGGTPTDLVTFSGSNGMHPEAGPILSGNTLYGTTDAPSVFSLPITGGTPTTLASLNGSNGGNLYGTLTLAGNALYGTTWDGGPSRAGNVFSLPMTGGTPTFLATFNGSNGQYPGDGLIVLGNTIYGTTWHGGASGDGTVFSVPIAGGTPTVLATFNGPNGANPECGLILVGNTLYGTTQEGGASGDGTIFSLPITGGTPTVLASFNGSNGQFPLSALTHVGNTLYGTTWSGGADDNGTVFSLPIAGGTPKVLASFNGSNGSEPNGALTLSGNTLCGTTMQGGTGGDGAVFALTPKPIISLSATAPTAFGSHVGTLPVTGSNGHYNITNATFTPAPTGYLAVSGGSGFDPTADPEVYALAITGSAPGNLAADLADAVSEINLASYSGFSLTASTTDPTGGSFGPSFDFYLTFSGSTLATGSPYFGFDFTQLNGITDTLSVSAVAVNSPEPASLALLASAAGLLVRRRARSR
jgi:uncharacterized repeat protein (TIGR03803 family)